MNLWFLMKFHLFVVVCLRWYIIWAIVQCTVYAVHMIAVTEVIVYGIWIYMNSYMLFYIFFFHSLWHQNLLIDAYILIKKNNFYFYLKFWCQKNCNFRKKRFLSFFWEMILTFCCCSYIRALESGEWFHMEWRPTWRPTKWILSNGYTVLLISSNSI